MLNQYLFNEWMSEWIQKWRIDARKPTWLTLEQSSESECSLGQGRRGLNYRSPDNPPELQRKRWQWMGYHKRVWVNNTLDKPMFYGRPATFDFADWCWGTQTNRVQSMNIDWKNNHEMPCRGWCLPNTSLEEFRAILVKRWFLSHIMVLTNGKIKCQQNNFLCGWMVSRSIMHVHTAMIKGKT